MFIRTHWSRTGTYWFTVYIDFLRLLWVMLGNILSNQVSIICFFMLITLLFNLKNKGPSARTEYNGGTIQIQCSIAVEAARRGVASRHPHYGSPERCHHLHSSPRAAGTLFPFFASRLNARPSKMSNEIMPF